MEISAPQFFRNIPLWSSSYIPLFVPTRSYTGTCMPLDHTRMPPGRDDIPAFTTAKLVLALANQNGCTTAELT